MKFTCKPQVKRPSQNLFADIPSLKPLPNNPDLFITHTPRSFPALSRATDPAYIVCLPVNLLSLLEDGGCRHSWSLDYTVLDGNAIGWAGFVSVMIYGSTCSVVSLCCRISISHIVCCSISLLFNCILQENLTPHV